MPVYKRPLLAGPQMAAQGKIAQMNAASQRTAMYGTQAQYYGNRADTDQAYALQTREGANVRMRQTVGNFVQSVDNMMNPKRGKPAKAPKKKTPWGAIGGGTAGMIAGGLLAVPTGGLSIAAGAALGMGLGGGTGVMVDQAVGGGGQGGQQQVQRALADYSSWLDQNPKVGGGQSAADSLHANPGQSTKTQSYMVPATQTFGAPYGPYRAQAAMLAGQGR